MASNFFLWRNIGDGSGVLLRGEGASAAAKSRESLEKEENIPLNIAITGETGTGKSSLVNAIRGVGDDDEGAAPTGTVETTMEVKSYEHPNFPNVLLWDLPGIGTMKNQAEKYLKKIKFEKFDFFIIVSADRFREHDVKLAKEIKKKKKKFYFVRSKIDQDLSNEARKGNFNKERILNEIRQNCTQGLLDHGLQFPLVFLVSSKELLFYDFPLLTEALERDLPELKRNAFLLAMPNTSLEMIDKKKKALQSKIKYHCTLSVVAAAVPIPGLTIAANLGLLAGVMTQYVFGFGLNTTSLKRLSNYTGVPFEELKGVITSPLAATDISEDLLVKSLAQTAGMAAMMVAEEGTKFIPILGIPISMGLSFTFTYKALNILLENLAEDAKRVFRRAML